MIKLGIIGTSNITDEFLSAIKLSSKFELSAIYSRTLEKGTAFAEKYGNIPVFTDFESMVKSGIEAIYIASPNSFHYAQSKFFIEHKINVICEKPIVCSSDEYVELKSLADKNNVIYMEAIMSVHCDSYDIIHKALKEISNISVARIDFCQRSSRLDDFYAGKKHNIFDMSFHAGTLMDLGIYCVYGAVDLFGLPNKITANAHYFDNGCDRSGISVFEYDKFSAVLTYSKTAQSYIHSEIVGDNGTLCIDSISQYAGIKLFKNGKETILYKTPDKPEIMRGEVDAFYSFITGEQSEKYIAKSVLCKNVHSCMDEIKKSAKIKYN